MMQYGKSSLIFVLLIFGVLNTTNAAQDSVSITITIEPSVNIVEENIPTEYSLQNAYPNPFNPSTNIRYGLPEQAKVQLYIYDIFGRRINTLVDDQQQAGWYTVRWNGLNQFGHSVSTGVYFFRIQAGTFVEVKKMVYMK